MILQYWRVWLLIVMVLGAVFAVGLKSYPYGRDGVVVIQIANESAAKDVVGLGSQITEINGEKIRNVADWEKAVQKAKVSINIVADGKPYSIAFNNTPGIFVGEIERTNLNFGIDIQGGVRILLSPVGNVTEDTVTQVIQVLQTRANIYGLREINFYPVYADRPLIHVESAGVGTDFVENLLAKQGMFEAKVTKPVKIGANNTARLQVGSKTYDVPVTANDTLIVEGREVKQRDRFTLDGIEFEYMNKSSGRLLLYAKVYDGKDIEIVYTDAQRSSIAPVQGGFEFQFGIAVSKDGAQKFLSALKGVDKIFDVNSGQEYLESNIILYLDGKEVSSLRIGASLADKPAQEVSIQGFETTQEGAVKERLRLQTILRSGALPTSLEIVSIDVISPTLGKAFIQSALMAGIAAIILVSGIIFLRYRNVKIAVPMILVSLSEVAIILGAAASGDAYIWGAVLVISFALITAAFLKRHADLSAYSILVVPLAGMISWTVDLASVAGTIAAIGTGINHQIIIADEALRGVKKEDKVLDIKDRIKLAFFIIIGAAMTNIGSMIPLAFIGAGLLRGFAITTIVGVAAGFLVTRPAYGTIVEKFVRK